MTLLRDNVEENRNKPGWNFFCKEAKMLPQPHHNVPGRLDSAMALPKHWAPQEPWRVGLGCRKPSLREDYAEPQQG